MSYFRFLLLALVFLTGSALISESAPVYMARRDSKFALVPLCDGFDFPVGKPDGNGYYRSRGLRLKSPRHMGEDWNGNKGGNSDLGDPVYSVGHGVVTYAADARGAWGKVVIVRHAFREPKSGKVLCCQTLYSHLNDINVVGAVGAARHPGGHYRHEPRHVSGPSSCGAALQSGCELRPSGDSQDGAQLRPPDGFYYPLPPPASGEKDGARSHRRVSALQGNGRTLTSGG